jgi:hypothetical protein
VRPSDGPPDCGILKQAYIEFIERAQRLFKAKRENTQSSQTQQRNTTMKKFALTAAALAVAFGAASPAFAESGDNRGIYDFDTTIVSVDRSNGTIGLSSGQTLDQSVEYFAFPATASVGDKVRVDIDGDNHTLKGVRVLN